MCTRISAMQSSCVNKVRTLLSVICSTANVTVFMNQKSLAADSGTGPVWIFSDSSLCGVQPFFLLKSVFCLFLLLQ